MGLVVKAMQEDQAMIAALREENARLRDSIAWVDEVYPAKNRESGGAIVHMTWEQWNQMRRVLGLRDLPIPLRYGAAVRIVHKR